MDMGYQSRFIRPIRSLLLGSDWRSGVLGRRQSLRQGCRRQALQEAVAGGRQRSFDILRRNRAYPELDGIITALVCPLDGVKVQ